MQERIRRRIQAAARPLQPHLNRVLERLLPVTSRLSQQLLRLWLRVNAIDIPLSPLQWVLLFYFVFGIAYLTATPIFEANDEFWHFGYVRHLRESGELPLQVFDGGKTLYAQHGSQPPVYYALAALLTAPLSLDDAPAYSQLNPHAALHQPAAFGNKNRMLPDPSLPLGGTGLAILLVRSFGLAMGAATIALIYKISAYIAPQRPTVAFTAAAITALNPMYIFISASVNNDSLSMLLNAAIVLLLLGSLRDGFQPRRSLAIGLLFALTSLTKLTGLVLLPILLAAALLIYRRGKDRRGLLLFCLSLLLFWLLIAAWWYIRNQQLYGEPLGILMMADIAGPRGITFSLTDLFAEYQTFRMSYWGLFGALNIQISAIFYILLDLMTLFSILGCIFLILQLLAIRDFAYARYELTHLAVLLSAFMLLWLGVFYWSTLTRTAQGRILFPLIAVISPILAVGFVEVVWWLVFSMRPPSLEFVRAGDAVPKKLLHQAMLLPLRLLGVAAFLVPLTVIASQYTIPETLLALPDNARPVYAEFGDVALIGYERQDRRYLPSENVRVKLYWQVLAQSAGDSSVFLSLVDDSRQEIGRYLSYPGAGRLRTSGWQSGALYADEYLLPIDAAAYGRYPFDLQVEWENLTQDRAIPATDAEGAPIAPVRLKIGAVVSPRIQPTSPSFAEIPADQQPNFDEVIRLQKFHIDLESSELVLNWQAEAHPGESYTVFVHVLDAEGGIIAQADAPPRLPTKYWRWGENYLTYHRFPPEFSLLDQTIQVGLYINDGLSYPRAEYSTQVPVEEDAGEELIDVFVDSYPIDWEIYYENLATPAADGTDEAGEASETSETAEPDNADAASES